MPISAARRRELKARAHHLKPVIHVGGKGISEAVIAETEIALDQHELIKVKLGGADRDDRKAMGEEFARRLKAEIVDTIGGVLILFRENPKKNKPKGPPGRAARR